MFKRTSHTKYLIRYHFVWIPKYRKRVLEGEIAKRIEELIRLCSEINEFEIVELKILSDHIHLLLDAKPQYSPSKIMNLIKGGSSKKIREEFPELEEIYWGDSFWCDGFFIETVGRINQDQVQEYIKNN